MRVLPTAGVPECVQSRRIAACACLRVCVCVCAACVYVRVRAGFCVRMRVRACAFVYVHVCACACVCAFAGAGAHVRVCVHAWMSAWRCDCTFCGLSSFGSATIETDGVYSATVDIYGATNGAQDHAGRGPIGRTPSRRPSGESPSSPRIVSPRVPVVPLDSSYSTSRVLV
jgi:hypothetical protein